MKSKNKETSSLLAIFFPSIVVSFKALGQCLELVWISLSKCMVTKPLDPHLHKHQQIIL